MTSTNRSTKMTRHLRDVISGGGTPRSGQGDAAEDVMDELFPSTSTPVDRRTLAKGVAWMAPAITIAAAAPSLAASPTTDHTFTGSADKCPGASDVPDDFPKHGYRLTLNVSPAPSLLTVVSVVTGNGKSATVISGPTPVGPGQWECIIDASSSPSEVIVTVSADGQMLTSSFKASPHCG